MNVYAVCSKLTVHQICIEFKLQVNLYLMYILYSSICRAIGNSGTKRNSEHWIVLLRVLTLLLLQLILSQSATDSVPEE